MHGSEKKKWGPSDVEKCRKAVNWKQCEVWLVQVQKEKTNGEKQFCLRRSGEEEIKEEKRKLFCGMVICQRGNFMIFQQMSLCRARVIV